MRYLHLSVLAKCDGLSERGLYAAKIALNVEIRICAALSVLRHRAVSEIDERSETGLSIPRL